MLNARRMDSTTTQNMCWGVQNTQGHYSWGYTALEKRPGTAMQTRRQRSTRTPVKHTHSTPAFHTTSEMFRIQPQASQQERIKSAQDHGLAPQSWRAIASEAQVAAHLSQHTNDQRAEAAQSMRHWLAEPPLAQSMSSVCLHQSPSSGAPASSSSSRSVERRASQLIQLEICVPFQPRTEQTFKPPVI
jgi:hypothetical protein